MTLRVWRLTLVVGLLVAAACNRHPSPSTSAGRHPTPYHPTADRRHCLRQAPDAPSCELYSVSLAELLVEPERWDGRRVQTAGYLAWRTDEGSTFGSLFPSADDARAGHTENAVSVGVAGLNTALKVGREGYVRLTGTFDAYSGSAVGYDTGTLFDVTALEWASGPR